MRSMKLRERFKDWKYWKNDGRGSKFYQLCVLIGLVKSPSFEAFRKIMHTPAPLFRKMDTEC